MSRKIRIMIGVGLVASSVIFSACSLTDKQVVDTKTVDERPGVTVKGTLVEVAGKYFLKSSGKDTEVNSKRVDLKSYVDTEVELHGEFSGTTLYVDSAK